MVAYRESVSPFRLCIFFLMASILSNFYLESKGVSKWTYLYFLYCTMLWELFECLTRKQQLIHAGVQEFNCFTSCFSQFLLLLVVFDIHQVLSALIGQTICRPQVRSNCVEMKTNFGPQHKAFLCFFLPPRPLTQHQLWVIGSA